MTTEIDGIPIIFGDKRQPKALPLSHPKARWGEFGTKTTVLPKGYTRRPGCLSLPCDILFERDVIVKLRDGTEIYVDIYRPTTQDLKSPALVAWSPYGKQGGRGNQVLDDFPFRMGIPLRKLSELQKWEGPDPAYWVHHGYAVINPDPRGVGKSGGNIYQWGSQEGRDGADVVDWVGSRDWCSGKVALTGNSYLSIIQWFIAAEKPKYLAAIAPWEGLSNLYHEAWLGGVSSKPALDFTLQILQVNAGENSWENSVEMGLRYKIQSAYHFDKGAKVEDIDVPAYVVASWSNPIHTYGTFRAYMRLKKEKWLRVHDNWEWPDYYEEGNRADLHRFFEHFLKGLDNGWLETPKVRAKILDTSIPLPLTAPESIFTSFPPAEVTPLKVFLDGPTKSLSPKYPLPSQMRYKASSGRIVLDYVFSSDTTLCGPLQLMLAVSLDSGMDSDIFIVFEKILNSGYVGAQLKVPYEKWWQSMLIRAAYATGLVSLTNVLFYKGPMGQVRVSRRMLDTLNHTPGLPVSDMSQYNPVQDGEVVQLHPPVTPIGMSFVKGEKLRVIVQGINPFTLPPVDQATLTVEGLEDINKEVSVVVHCGMQDGNGSCVILPIVKGIA